MPVNVHHAIMFTFVFVVIVSLLSATTYTIVTNMLIDAYRYEESIEKANEKLRLVAIVSSDGLYYGVRNIATTTITIRELGIIDTYNRKHRILSDLTLKPGEAYVGRIDYYYKGAIYAITGRGNVFSTPVITLTEFSGEQSFNLKGLTPACIQAPSPIHYIGEYVYTVGICTYAYVFGYIIVDDPYSDDSIYLVFGPYNVADLYKSQKIPFSSTRVREIKGNIYVEASFKFVIDKFRDRVPYYRILMPLDIERRDNRKGLILHGCVGILWRTISNTIAGIRINTYPVGTCISRGDERACEYLGSFTVPSALDMKSLTAYLAQKRLTQLPVEAPSGTQVYIVYSRCFTVESKTLRSVETSEAKPWANIGIITLYTYLDFPGVNKSNIGDIYVDGVDVSLTIDPEILVLGILNQV